MPPDVAGSARGCLPADQSCFALSAGSSPYSFSSRQDSAAARACCTATSYLVVLGISFSSLLAILLMLCAILWYLVRRSDRREAAEAAAAAPEADKKRPTGLDVDAIAALPEFVYRKGDHGEDEEDERECAVCLGAMADGEAARRLPRCAHVFHRGCVDVWLRDQSTCPVCRAEVVICRPAGECCAEKEGGAASRSRASASTARPPRESSADDDDGERDLEAQL
jgi:E3 ubiquitin-protein ligase ATL41